MLTPQRGLFKVPEDIQGVTLGVSRVIHREDSDFWAGLRIEDEQEPVYDCQTVILDRSREGLICLVELFMENVPLVE